MKRPLKQQDELRQTVQQFLILGNIQCSLLHLKSSPTTLKGAKKQLTNLLQILNLTHRSSKPIKIMEILFA